MGIMSYKCPKCNKTFTRNASLTYHIDHNACKKVEKVFKCKYCDKTFSVKNSMYRHMRETCNAKKRENIYEELIELRKDVESLKKENEKLKNVPKTDSDGVTNNTINGDININNGTINNITIVAYGKEDMEKIDRDDIIKALKTGFNSTMRLTEAVHFNPKYPSYSNIKRSNFNMKNKVMYHNGDHWVTTSDPHMIDDLYNRKRDFIEENIDIYRDGLTQQDMTRLERWMGVDDDDRRITRIKDESREILFNKKEISEMNEKQLNASGTTIIDLDDSSLGNANIQGESDSNQISCNITGKKRRVIARRNGKYRKTIIKVK